MENSHRTSPPGPPDAPGVGGNNFVMLTYREMLERSEVILHNTAAAHTTSRREQRVFHCLELFSMRARDGHIAMHHRLN